MTGQQNGNGLRQRRPAPIPRRRVALMAAALCCVLMLFFMVSRCSHRHTSPFAGPVKSGGDTIDVAIEISPLSYSMAGDSISGLDYEMITRMTSMHGRPVRLHPFAPLKYALKGLEDGTFDIVISSLPSTRRLKDTLLLTDPVYLDREVLVQRRSDTTAVRRAEDLGGREVWLAEGSPLADRIHNLAAELGDTITVRSLPGHTAEHLVLLVSAGKIPNAVVNEGIARTVCNRDTTLAFDTPVSFTQFQTWAVSPHNPALRDTLNVWLRQFKNTSAYRTLLERHGMRAE